MQGKGACIGGERRGRGACIGDGDAGEWVMRSSMVSRRIGRSMEAGGGHRQSIGDMMGQSIGDMIDTA